MKTFIPKKQQGSTLVVTVVISALIGSVLCSYLVLIGSRNEGAMRAMAWNTAMPVLEAGIEEALTHLNVDKNSPDANNWNMDRINGKKVYWKRGELPDKSYFYVTNSQVTSTEPTIYAAGYVQSPLRNNEYISRLVRVTTTNPPSPFNMAIAASGPVQLSGSAVVDGYNSALGPYSSANRNASGGIGTDSQQVQPPAINVGSARVFGIAVTGPGGAVVVNGGSVGDLDQAADIKPGWTNDNMNVAFQDNSPPSGSSTGLARNSDGTYPALDSSAFTIDSFSSNSTNRPLVVTGNATLWVKGDFTVSGSGYVYIAPNASLKLYVGGRTSISGGGIVNGTGLPKNFSYFGLPTNSYLSYSGSADFVGTINAPEATVNLSGTASLYGAVICNSFNFSGNSGVHYDQALGGGGIFMVTSWREL